MTYFAEASVQCHRIVPMTKYRVRFNATASTGQCADVNYMYVFETRIVTFRVVFKMASYQLFLCQYIDNGHSEYSRMTQLIHTQHRSIDYDRTRPHCYV